MNVSPPTGKDIAELLLLFAPKNSLIELDLSETTIDEFASFFDQCPRYAQTSTTALALYYANRGYRFEKSYLLVSKLYIAPDVIHSLIDLTRSEEFSEAESIFSEFAKEKRSEQARKAANAKHKKPNGSREKAGKIRAIWASGKYTSRDICAEQEYAALGYGSFKAARKALINTPEPT